MVRNDLDRTVANESFEYGDHTIVVLVTVTHEYIPWDGTGYRRWVKVRAKQNGEAEVKNKGYVNLDPDDPDPLSWWERLLCRVFGTDPEAVLEQRRKDAQPLPIEDHIERNVRPVLEELDTIYGYLDRTYDIDVEVGMNRVKHEVSWVEVEDEIDRIAAELDGVAA